MEPLVPERGFLAGGGEMGERVRSLEWDLTPLGPPERWPQSLRSAVSICLGSAFPIALYWGPELTLLYNDAWSPIPGAKHPRVLGQRALEAWPEIWSMIGPLFAQVMSSGEAVYSEDQLLPMERHGYREECYFNFTFSPVRGESGGVDGVFNAVLETTYRVVAERRETSLRELAEQLGLVQGADDACSTAVETLCRDPHDTPFAAIYRRGAESKQAQRVAYCPALSESLAPETLPLEGGSWPLSEAITSGAPVAAALRESLVMDPWPEPVTHALVIALESPGIADQFVLVMGTSPRRAIDDDYCQFGARVGGQISRALANASAYELQRERARTLAELDAAKTSFFSNVSHEFRTPLTLILGPLETLDSLLDAPGGALTREREELSVIRRNARRLQRLVDTLLDFSRLEAGKVEPTIERVDLSRLTRELSGMFQSTLDKAGVGLEIDCAPMPRDAFVDREMWEKVVLNLLSNAFKFTLEGEVGVSLRADGDAAVLVVRDTGSGIPEDELPKLFQRFHRVPRSSGRSHEGSGIGLALVRDLVALHGGQVGVESELGKGSTFTVRVPLGAPTDDIQPRAEVPVAARARPFIEEAMRWLPQTDARTDQPSGSERILVVDDNPDMREYIGRLLGSYRVEFATTGAEGLAAVEMSRPDLVVTDVMMPDVDGLSLVAALRGDPSHSTLPILMVSGRAGEDARLEGIETGADEYLVKPFSARELIARVSGLLALASARDEANAAVRESELRFRNMADHAPVMIWMTEADGSCSFLNRTWYDFTGQTPDTGLGFGWLEAVHPEDRAASQATFVEANEDHIGFRLEYRLRRSDGEYRWAIDAAAPRFEDGPFLGYIGSVIDISELRAVTEALRDTDRRKDEFLATLAHEIRNPLAAIRHGVEVLKSSSSEDGRVGLIVERQITHLVRLVDDLLDVSRISRGKIELEAEALDLRAAVRTAIETARPLIEERGHTLTVGLPDEPVVVRGDRVRLEQVFANLLTNAAYYTPPGGNLDVGATTSNAAVEVSVSDDGIGLTGDEVTSVFGLFTQVISPDRLRSGGLGVGLSLVQRLVGMHGGTVRAQSEGRMEGSRFAVTLPLALQPVAAQEAATTSARSRFVVVLADDNEDAVELFAMLLTALGHEVHVGQNGQEAVDLVSTHHPDIVLLDIGMPVMDGLEACREIRKLPGGDRMLVVAQTGWGQEEDRRRSAEAGFDQHLVKPVSRETLEELFTIAPALLASRRNTG